MYCTNCGTPIPDGSSVCPQCGHAVARESADSASADGAQAAGQPAQRDGGASDGAGDGTPANATDNPGPAAPDPSGDSGRPGKGRRAKKVVAVLCSILAVVVVAGAAISCVRQLPDRISDQLERDDGDDSGGSAGSKTKEEDGYNTKDQGADAAGFQPNSDGSFGSEEAPVEGETVVEMGDLYYVVTADQKRVVSVAKSGGEPTTVFDTASNPAAVGEDGTAGGEWTVGDLLVVDDALYVAGMRDSDASVVLWRIDGGDGSSAELVWRDAGLAYSYEPQLFLSEGRITIGYATGDEDESKGTGAVTLDEDGSVYASAKFPKNATPCVSGKYYWEIDPTQKVVMRIDPTTGESVERYDPGQDYDEAQSIFASDECVYLVGKQSMGISGMWITAIDGDGLQGTKIFNVPQSVLGSDVSSTVYRSCYIDCRHGAVYMVVGVVDSQHNVTVEVVRTDLSGGDPVLLMSDDTTNVQLDVAACGEDVAVIRTVDGLDGGGRTVYVAKSDGSGTVTLLSEDA